MNFDERLKAAVGEPSRKFEKGQGSLRMYIAAHFTELEAAISAGYSKGKNI